MSQKAKAIKAIRGMNDILPAQSLYFQHIETCLQQVASAYGYREIRFPLLEHTALFKRTVGEATDIVEKEMYTFSDRNGDSLTLRPEGTAGCARAAIENSLIYNQTQRLWYLGPMFRHERPQKGRYRQFYQFGIEAYGFKGPDIDVEQILLMARVWKTLGLDSAIELQVNSLGSKEARSAYQQALVYYFEKLQSQLDEDSVRRLKTNPLRILDSKNKDMQSLISEAPRLMDYLDEASRAHFEHFCLLLDQVNIPYQINPRLVRGLDYYNLTVYEWVTDKLGAQSAVCAGGRYDGLIEQLGGKDTPAVGFAMGLERVALLLESIYEPLTSPDFYLILLGDEAQSRGLSIAETIRDKAPGCCLVTHLGGTSMKKQIKRADQSGAKIALILGEEELKENKLQIHYLRADKPSIYLNLNQLDTIKKVCL